MPAPPRKKNVYENTRKLRTNKVPLYKAKKLIKPYKIKTVKIPLYKAKKFIYIPLKVRAKELLRIPLSVKARKIIKLSRIKAK
jgi:hypothetical protein